MSGRIAVLATTVADGRAYVDGVYLATDVAAIVTPRTASGVRVAVDHVTMTEAWPTLPAAQRLRTLDAVLPALATSTCRACHDELARTIADDELEVAEAAR